MKNKTESSSNFSFTKLARYAGPVNERLLNHPKRVLLISFLIIVICAGGILQVKKDPSVDAFVPQSHPAAQNRDLAKSVFGLEDPVIVGLVAPKGQSVFTPKRLAILRELDAEVRQIEGVKKNDVISLANQNAISGKDGDLLVEPIIADGTINAISSELARSRVQSMPMLKGILVAEDESLLSIIIPVEEPDNAYDTVEAIKHKAMAIASDQFTVHVAGVAAMNARLSNMVNSDTRIFVPVAVLTVLVILIIANRRPLAVLGPLLVIIGSAAVAIGLMGWAGSRYYLITTALPVVIMAIAVADCLHITTYYLQARQHNQELSAKEGVIIALNKAWLPVCLTSFTTIAAFMGMSVGAAMKPISEFGYYSSIGVLAACLLSLTLLPAILILTNLSSSKNEKPGHQKLHHTEVLVHSITRFAARRPITSLASVAVLSLVLVVFASQSVFDYERKRYFTQNDPVRVADQEINARLEGINFLDLVVTSTKSGGLLTPASLANIQALRKEIADIPYVNKVSGIDEYIALMHTSLVGESGEALPTKDKAPAQYMFLYEASAPPEDFKQQIDFDHRQALIRAQLSTDSYSKTLESVSKLELLAKRFSEQTGLEANISGRVAVNEGWMSQLANTHFIGLGLAMVLVLVATVIAFKSIIFAALAMVPVVLGVVAVYANMGLLSIDIAPATSMTAAIATGLGIDFGIHLVTHIKKSMAKAKTMKEVFAGSYATVARACFYSAIALGVALSVICISSAPPLRWFGLLVAIGAFGSLIGALFIIPALWSMSTILTKKVTTHASV